MEPMDGQRSPMEMPKSRGASGASSTYGDSPEAAEQETFVYLAFKSQRERDEWFTIFRSLAKLPLENGRLARPHRRLKVGVLDLAEANITNLQPWTRRYGDGSSTQADDALSAGSISSEGLRGSSKLALSPKTHSRTDPDSDIRRVAGRPGWSWRERMRVEL